MKITLKMYFLAKKGQFHEDEYMLYGYLTFKLLEDVGGKIRIEGIENLKKVKEEKIITKMNLLIA